jgi:hypothetical protein
MSAIEKKLPHHIFFSLSVRFVLANMRNSMLLRDDDRPSVFFSNPYQNYFSLIV